MIFLDTETNLAHNKIWLCVTRKEGIALRWLSPDGLQEYLGDNIVVAHNLIGFDKPVLEEVWNIHIDNDKCIDTLVLSRLYKPDIDVVSIEGSRAPSPHSLEAWGIRLGSHKIAFTDYDAGYSEEMAVYCEQDTALLEKLFYELTTQLNSLGFSARSILLEHAVAFICKQMEDNGFMLDMQKTMGLHAMLAGRMSDIETQMCETFKPTYETLKTPEYWEVVTPDWKEFKAETKGELLQKIKEAGYKAGLIKEAIAGPMRVREHPFNPGSRQQIAERLIELGVKFKKKTEKGNIIVDETVLEGIDLPEAKLVAEYLMIQKRVAQIASWLELVKDDGRVHGRITTNGAVTGRMTHSSPNMGQIPSVGNPYGGECREVWVVPENKVMVGVDLSGIELRCMSHYLQDEGWQHELLNGDVHWKNAQSFGLIPDGTVKDDSNPDHKKARNLSKTLVYAASYGAGAAKIGSIVGANSSQGKKLLDNFINNTPGLAALKKKISKFVSRGHLPGLDGRRVWIRSEHAALNTLLQSAGAIIAKQWLVESHNKYKEHSLNVRLLAVVHDEVVLECLPEQANLVKEITIQAAYDAGVSLGFRCPVGAEGRIGENWRDVH